jgi:hypothetical protein
MAWSLRSLAVNEFRSNAYDDINEDTLLTTGETYLNIGEFTVHDEACDEPWIW